ncbi:MAG TPA: MOSC and FAD-binding oxidoreductase domain-containing protein [Candidatus Eisenbacteria bacterium]|nr:MOSC and FAD-binding oxidoreductase domain-containing protein [Candidatus Eisenbacteria bacterium]
MARLLSVNVGLPRDVSWQGEKVFTSVWKEPLQGRRMVRRLNVDGDGQGDLSGHGGEHRAVLVYQMDSYRYWEQQLGRTNFTFGQFGENFTIEGLPDGEVCIGDRYRIGGALFEVTQPRVTCYRVGIRMDEPRMAALLVSHHRPGFYLRVLEEGEVGSGDEIVKIADGPERLTVAEIDALLYLPGHSRELLERSLRIPALSAGWQASFQALLEQETNQASTGNAGLTAAAIPPPAWPGFRTLRVARLEPESSSVTSLSFESVDENSLPVPLPGQFLVLRFRPTPDAAPIRRSYSMSGAPQAGTYRVSIKQEVDGLGSTFLCNHVKVGDVLEASAPRGNFTLRAGERPVVLLSAGIGATPLLAMLHELSSKVSHREIWWLYGTRNRGEHPFATESRALIGSLPLGRSYICYSRPSVSDRLGQDYDAPGRFGVPVLKQLGVPQDADFYLCGPAEFLRTLTTALSAWGVSPHRVFTEIFGSVDAIRPGIHAAQTRSPHQPEGTPGHGPQISFTRSGLTVAWRPEWHSLLELAEACDVPVRWSCRTGVCHTCESAVIAGAVAYRPEPLEPPAEGSVLICCSRPRGDLEIDL